MTSGSKYTETLKTRECGLFLGAYKIGGSFGTSLHPISTSPERIIANAQRAAKRRSLFHCAPWPPPTQVTNRPG